MKPGDRHFGVHPPQRSEPARLAGRIETHRAAGRCFADDDFRPGTDASLPGLGWQQAGQASLRDVLANPDYYFDVPAIIPALGMGQDVVALRAIPG